MAPGIFQLRTACCSIVVPIRLALCIPLLICIFDGYSAGATLQRTGTIPIKPDTPEQHDDPFASTTDLDATDGIAPTARLLTVYTVIPSTSCPGRALAIAFTVLAIAFSLASMTVAFFYHEDASVDEFSVDDLDDGHGHKTAAAERRAAGGMSKHKWRLWNLSVGMATRLLLAALGTTAFVRLLAEQERIKPGSFAAIEGLGWTVVAMLYLGSFHRIFVLLSDPELHLDNIGVLPCTSGRSKDHKDHLGAIVTLHEKDVAVP